MKSFSEFKKDPFYFFVGILVVVLGASLYFYSEYQSRIVDSRISGQVVNLAEAVMLKDALISKNIIREESHFLGSKSGTVVLTQFSDYQCPSCQAGWEISKKLIEHYKDDPRFTFVFRQSPVSKEHRFARKAAEAAEVAGEQGKFWEMHTILFEKQSEWSASKVRPTDLFEKYAEEAGVPDSARFRQALLSGRYRPVVVKDSEDSKINTVTATPTYFINTEKYSGTLSYEAILSAIESRINAQ